MSDTPSPGAAAESARVPTVPQIPAARARKNAPAAATPAPHPAVSILDKLGELVAILGFLFLGYHRVLDGGQTIGSVLGVVGLNLGLRKIGDKIAGHGHGLGIVGLVVAGASGYGAHVVHGLRVVLPGLLGAFVLLSAAGCASGPRSTDATVKTVLSVATLARDTACGPMLDGYLGRPQPVSLDAPAGTVVEVTQRIRDWLCGDTLAGLLDLARDLSADLTRARPSSAPPAPSSAAPRASPTPAASPPPTAPPEASGEVSP